MKIALLGAESTGKSELGSQLTEHLQAQGNTVLHLAEYLRQWCDAQGRTPQQAEQAGIATEQTQRIQTASDATPQADYLIADTTALMIAIYSQHYFNDSSLLTDAMANQHPFDITLLMGLDMPWVADGIQRDGAHVRKAIDTRIRQTLTHANIPFHVIYGTGKDRLANALQAIQTPSSSQVEATLDAKNVLASNARITSWTCDRCSDPDCEHRLFTRFL